MFDRLQSTNYTLAHISQSIEMDFNNYSIDS